MLESLRQDSSYMEQRAARQAEARERWVEGLSFQPASIKQPDRPPLSAADQAKETVEKVRAGITCMRAQCRCETCQATNCSNRCKPEKDSGHSAAVILPINWVRRRAWSQIGSWRTGSILVEDPFAGPITWKQLIASSWLESCAATAPG